MQGISVYQRQGRPTWYVAYDCPRRSRRVNESTGYLVADARGKLQAYAYARERSASGITHGEPRDASGFEHWAQAWLEGRYRGQPKTLTSYLGAWKQISFFLRENKIFLPRLLQYQHVVDFVHWREQQIKRQSRRKVSRNTALHNVKVLSRIMREAIRRGYAQGNPCVRLAEDLPADPVPEKPEFTDDQIQAVRAELARRSGLGRPSDWMAIAFEIALHQGVRISATQIPLADIDLERGLIKLREKGRKGQPAIFTLPLHPGIRPLLAELKAQEDRKFTCILPRFASRNFSRVMRAMGLPHTFHCTRVSVITRMARGDVSEQKAMCYVHHGSWAIHRIYSRLKPPDVAGVAAALALPAPFSAAPAPEPGRG